MKQRSNKSVRSSVGLSGSLRILVLAVLIGASLCSAQAGTFLNTLVWTRYVKCESSKLLVDPSGNTYVVYTTPDNTGTDVSYIKFDPSGNVVASHFLLFRTSPTVTLRGVYLSPPSSPTTYLYTSLSEIGPYTTIDAVTTKSDLTGHTIWQSSFINQTVSYTPIGGFVDSSDNYWSAITLAGQASTLLFDKWDPSGALVFQTGRNDIIASHADFVSGKWSAVGADASAADPSVSARWGVYDPASGQRLTGAVFDSFDDGFNTYTYTPIHTAHLDDAGFMNLGVSFRATDDTDSSIFTDEHFVAQYTLSGSNNWTSSNFVRVLDFLTSSGSFAPIFTQASGGTNNIYTEQFTNSGTRSWISPAVAKAAAYQPVSDLTGVYGFVLDPAKSTKINIFRYDLTGTPVWTTSILGAVSGVRTASVDDSIDKNNNLYISVLFPITGGLRATVQRYVQGVALSAVSAPLSSYKGGATIPIKILLNAPAPTGGMTVKMTSNTAKALFPNNALSYTAVVPQGSTYIILNVHTSAVTANTSVVIQGIQSTVHRTAPFSLTP